MRAGHDLEWLTREEPHPSSRNTDPHTTVSILRVKEAGVTLSPFTHLDHHLEALQ